MTIYHGYKAGKHVATIEQHQDRTTLWETKSEPRAIIGGFHPGCRLETVKAAWRRIDGPGTRWRAE